MSMYTAQSSDSVYDLKRKRDKYTYTNSTLVEYENKLKREKNHSCVKKALSLFSFPFGRDAFAGLSETYGLLLVTILFAGCSIFIAIAILFCAIVDFLYIILYGLFFPFACVFYAIFKSVRIKSFEKKIKELSLEVSRYDISAIEKQIKEKEKDLCTYSSSSGVENTDWYKQKSDEYYRLYMNYPPRDDSLPDYATDVTYDLHPGDY